MATALVLCLKLSGDTDSVCVATALTLFKKEKESLLDQTVIQKITTIQTRKSRDIVNVQ